MCRDGSSDSLFRPTGTQHLLLLSLYFGLDRQLTTKSRLLWLLSTTHAPTTTRYMYPYFLTALLLSDAEALSGFIDSDWRVVSFLFDPHSFKKRYYIEILLKFSEMSAGIHRRSTNEGHAEDPVVFLDLVCCFCELYWREVMLVRLNYRAC
jgi:hypothetical protein